MSDRLGVVGESAIAVEKRERGRVCRGIVCENGVSYATIIISLTASAFQQCNPKRHPRQALPSPMRLAVRRLLYLSFICAFCVTAAVVLLYLGGYSLPWT